MKLTAKTMKATVVLDAAEMAGLTVPNGAKTFPITVAVAGRTLRAELNPKTLRKCLTQIAEAGPDGVALVLQGKLEAGDVLAEAGLTAQIKTPKPAAAAA
jgi:hypothetical protein